MRYSLAILFANLAIAVQSKGLAPAENAKEPTEVSLTQVSGSLIVKVLAFTSWRSSLRFSLRFSLRGGEAKMHLISDAALVKWNICS
jgi:hypothetical protein